MHQGLISAMSIFPDYKLAGTTKGSTMILTASVVTSGIGRYPGFGGPLATFSTNGVRQTQESFIVNSASLLISRQLYHAL